MISSPTTRPVRVVVVSGGWSHKANDSCAPAVIETAERVARQMEHETDRAVGSTAHKGADHAPAR